MSLTRLVYASRSHLVEAERRLELARILATARQLNDRNDVTGFLMATPRGFAQILEGADAAVDETYGRITADPRHGGLRLLVREATPQRRFASWSMAFAERNETTEFIFSLYGVSPEAELFEQPLDTLLDLADELASFRA